MIQKAFKTIFGKKKVHDKKEGPEKLAVSLKNRSQQFGSFLVKFLNDSVIEYNSIREKCKNLQNTNYELGLKHLENNNVDEAIFRFKITKKFWPNCHNANYQLAYCYSLIEKYYKAEPILNEIIAKNLSNEEFSFNQEARDLLEHIKQISQNQQS